MSDPFLNDPNANDPNRRVYIDEERRSGMGALIGIVVVALLIVGGIVFYNANHGTNVASNDTGASSSTANPVRPIPPAPTPTPAQPPAAMPPASSPPAAR
jgi:hypothetical protein